jgi:SAM-dependent methyltransferase
MTVFGAYARYYDLLYRDKDYRSEADHIDTLIKSLAPKSSSVLELGSGTGAHAVLLAQNGYGIHGVDSSEQMLAAAQERLQRHPVSGVSFSHGDARTVRLGKKFDVVISIFHVMSYQQTNADLAAAFATARAHLDEGGIFLFDCWYGPAVLTDRPVVRVRRIEDEKSRITRVAEPVMHPAENLVDVNFQVFLKDKASGETSEITETHRMRYLFSPEVKQLLELTRLTLVHSGEWLTNRPLSYGTWVACFGARAI